MVQMARHAVDEIDGALLPVRFVLHDHDAKFCTSFQTMLQRGRSAFGKSVSAAHQLNAVRYEWWNGQASRLRNAADGRTDPAAFKRIRLINSRKDGS